MDVKDVLKEENLIVVGDTENKEKYAYRIVDALKRHGYSVFEVNKSNPDFSERPEGYEVIDLVINPKRGLELLRSADFTIRGVVIQPGAGSDEIRSFLDGKGIPYVDGCVLKALGEA